MNEQPDFLQALTLAQITLIQWATTWYPAGKTSMTSRFNIPGKLAWITMEVPGFLTLLYVMSTLPAEVGLKALPWENKAIAGLFVSRPDSFLPSFESLIQLHRQSTTSTVPLSPHY